MAAIHRKGAQSPFVSAEKYLPNRRELPRHEHPVPIPSREQTDNRLRTFFNQETFKDFSRDRYGAITGIFSFALPRPGI